MSLFRRNKKYPPKSYSDINFSVAGEKNFLMGNFKGALQFFSYAIHANPQNVEAYFYRGKTFEKLDDPDKAIKDYRYVLSMNPSHDNAHFRLAVLQYNKNEFLNALKSFDKTIELNPEYPNVYFHRGLTNAKLNNYESAVEDFNKAFEKNDKLIVSVFNRANAYAKLKSYKEAVDDLNFYITNHPSNASAYYLRGICKIALNISSEAEVDFEKALGMGHLEAKTALEKYCIAKAD